MEEILRPKGSRAGDALDGEMVIHSYYYFLFFFNGQSIIIDDGSENDHSQGRSTSVSE